MGSSKCFFFAPAAMLTVALSLFFVVPLPCADSGWHFILNTLGLAICAGFWLLTFAKDDCGMVISTVLAVVPTVGAVTMSFTWCTSEWLGWFGLWLSESFAFHTVYQTLSDKKMPVGIWAMRVTLV